MTNEESIESVASVNTGYDMASALQIRLNTDPLLQQVEFFLRGLEPNTVMDKDGNTRVELKEMGKPKLNKAGIQAILNKCRALINPSVVQGSFKEAFYFQLISDIRKEIAVLLFINRYTWELQNSSDLKEITETIMNMVEPFLSRTVGNKERLSYAQTIRTNETSRVGGGFTLPFGGNK